MNNNYIRHDPPQIRHDPPQKTGLKITYYTTAQCQVYNYYELDMPYEPYRNQSARLTGLVRVI